jgi:hypothetical protein
MASYGGEVEDRARGLCLADLDAWAVGQGRGNLGRGLPGPDEPIASQDSGVGGGRTAEGRPPEPQAPELHSGGGQHTEGNAA